MIDTILNIENCEILIGIFWKRLGTPIKQGGKTGTEHEFYKAYEAWKENGKPHIMLYFKTKQYFPKTSGESEQQTAVLKFKESFPKEGLYWEYRTLNEFKENVLKHLTYHLRKYQSIKHLDDDGIKILNIIAEKSGRSTNITIRDSAVIRDSGLPFWEVWVHLNQLHSLGLIKYGMKVAGVDFRIINITKEGLHLNR